ncbi:Hypothetical predicted protein [Paramuricea clavata]|uniref:Uncharacterized protein n=1 Tax=Paramuricea clavata TaxID=317549 RepID=A0A6S7LM07_PARCT|nr:Hypothetical predicted protein [Paramuricea clavata]
MAKKLAIRSLRRGIGSMDYVNTLLIMEDDLDEADGSERMGEFGESSECPSNVPSNANEDIEGSSSMTQNQGPSQDDTPPAELPEWCKCGKCRPMPQEIYQAVS